jgi:malic enzyme
MSYRQDALDYQGTGRPGKIAVVPTKPALTQRDLSLACSPGVAEPCRRIAEEPEEIIRSCGLLEPTVGRIDPEDLGAAECFPIEEEPKRGLDIPVLHGVLLAMDRGVHVLQRGSTTADILSLAAIAVADAQERRAGR